MNRTKTDGNPVQITIRKATFRDVPGILALKKRIKGVSLPWGGTELFSQIFKFPEGQFIAVCARTHQVVGALGTLVIARSDYSLMAKWEDLTAGGTFNNHDLAHGKTLLRSHLILDPYFDTKQTRDLLSQAELDIANKLELDRIRAGVRFKDYYLFHHLAPREYFREIEQGLISDSWITQTLERGFKPLALVSCYYPRDWRSEGYAVVAQLELRNEESRWKGRSIELTMPTASVA